MLLLFMIAADVSIGSAPYIGIVVTGLLFAISQLIMVIKWGNNLDKSTAVLASRMDNLAEGLVEVEKTLKTLADVNVRFDSIEASRADRKIYVNEKLNDHENRLRIIERPTSWNGKQQ